MRHFLNHASIWWFVKDSEVNGSPFPGVQENLRPAQKGAFVLLQIAHYSGSLTRHSEISCPEQMPQSTFTLTGKWRQTLLSDLWTHWCSQSAPTALARLSGDEILLKHLELLENKHFLRVSALLRNDLGSLWRQCERCADAEWGWLTSGHRAKASGGSSRWTELSISISTGAHMMTELKNSQVMFCIFPKYS